MIMLNNHDKIKIRQRDQESGCIPTGFEWIIRFSKIKNTDMIDDSELDDFQEKFNLAKNGLGENSFVSIRNAIQEKYPKIKIAIKNFIESHCGIEKVEFIKKIIINQSPCLISLPVFSESSGEFIGFHILPVIGFSSSCLFFYDPGTGKYEDKTFNEIEMLHEGIDGGRDIAWLLLR